MRWFIEGADSTSGKDVRTVVDAASQPDARRIANERGILVASAVEMPSMPEPQSPRVPEPQRLSPPASTGDNAPLIVARGANGQIELYPGFVRIRRKGLLALMTQGIKGDKDIRLEHITSVQFKRAGLTNGFIQFTFGGGREAKVKFLQASKDENTVMFPLGRREEFEALRDAIEQLRSRPAATLSGPSIDDLERLATLRDRGVITQDELEARKRRVAFPEPAWRRCGPAEPASSLARLGQRNLTPSDWAWIVTGSLILGGLGTFASAPLAAPFLLVAGAIVMPPLWQRLRVKVASISPETPQFANVVRAAVVVCCLLLFGVIHRVTRPEPGNRTSIDDRPAAAPVAAPSIPAAPTVHEVTISQLQYGSAWPFTVDSGVLSGKPTGRKLSDGTELAEVTFATGGKTYYVNGTAKGTHRYADLDDIWALDSSLPKELAIKKNIGPIIDRGLKLAKGIDEAFVAPKAAEPPVVAASGQVTCDKFDVLAAFEPGANASVRRVRVSVKTDLPDNTDLMVSVRRSFFNSSDNDEYSIDYFDEKSTVAAWRAGQVVELDQAKWQAKLEEKRTRFRTIGERLDVTKLDSAVTVAFVVPINQSDTRFGLRNVNLVGAAVDDVDGLRIVRRQSKLAWPVVAK